MKEKTLSEKREWLLEALVAEEKAEEELLSIEYILMRYELEIKQFIKEILDDLIKRQNFLAKEMPPEWEGFFNEIEEIKEFIKQKAGY